AESVERNPPPQIPLTLKGLDLIAAMSKQMTITNGGLEFYGLTYAGYEHKELLRSAGGKFNTLVKWNPDDLGYMYVQHAQTKEWVTLSCTRPEYANGLTWNQHRLVRKVARGELRRGRKVEDLLAAKQRLHELWMNPLLQKNKKLELESAKRFSRL
ncbi:hypothetical protein ACQV5M_21545, partial [Leptospira sp. SA-E8]|uniref:hypothetical protein n=1 Tax=Leptospira sp. SA-E8 TaxID=3422259 RepID=UPI003EBAEDC9